MDKVTRQCPETTTFLMRKESQSSIEPRSFRFQPNALPLGQTSSHNKRSIRTHYILSGLACKFQTSPSEIANILYFSLADLTSDLLSLKTAKNNSSRHSAGPHSKWKKTLLFKLSCDLEMGYAIGNQYQHVNLLKSVSWK